MGATLRSLARTGPLLSYYPANGLADQLRQLSLALALARVLGRRLVLPPILPHGAATVLTVERDWPWLVHTSPSLTSLIDIDSSAAVIEGTELVPVHEMPRCDSGALADAGEAARRPCVAFVDPPELGEPVGAKLRSLAALGNVGWLHFVSTLDVQAARRARPRRFPLSQWERAMVPAPCAFSYRANLIGAAHRLLRSVLPAASRLHAAHVRAGRQAQSKAECTEEWLARLVAEAVAARAQAAERHSSPRAPLLYVAADDLPFVLPRARGALAPLGWRVVSRIDAANASGWRTVHTEPTIAALAVDVAAILTARRFWPAPRSGLSVHLAAMRACDRGGVCDAAQAAACVDFTSSGCGGRFPPGLLGSNPAEPQQKTCPPGNRAPTPRTCANVSAAASGSAL